MPKSTATVRVTKDSQSILFKGKVVLTIHENHKGFPAGSPGPIELEGVSPDGKWILYAIDPQGSASLAADGLVLEAISSAGGRSHTVAGGLLYPDYRSWCDNRTLVVVAGGSRMAVDNKRLILVSAPSWKGRNLRPQDYRRVFGSVECAPDGNSVVVQEAPQSTNGAFLHTRWQLWRVGLDGKSTRLTSPPPGYSDESPHFSPDQRTIYFVRSHNGIGALYALRDGKLLGPLLSLGAQGGYYGHTTWPYSVTR
jgi:Tol biopolymer transport system component